MKTKYLELLVPFADIPAGTIIKVKEKEEEENGIIIELMSGEGTNYKRILYVLKELILEEYNCIFREIEEQEQELEFYKINNLYINFSNIIVIKKVRKQVIEIYFKSGKSIQIFDENGKIWENFRRYYNQEDILKFEEIILKFEYIDSVSLENKMIVVGDNSFILEKEDFKKLKKKML